MFESVAVGFMNEIFDVAPSYKTFKSSDSLNTFPWQATRDPESKMYILSRVLGSLDFMLWPQRDRASATIRLHPCTRSKTRCRTCSSFLTEVLS